MWCFVSTSSPTCLPRLLASLGNCQIPTTIQSKSGFGQIVARFRSDYSQNLAKLLLLSPPNFDRNSTVIRPDHTQILVELRPKSNKIVAATPGYIAAMIAPNSDWISIKFHARSNNACVHWIQRLSYSANFYNDIVDGENCDRNGGITIINMHSRTKSYIFVKMIGKLLLF